ncbi:MAG: hypothetical protein J6V06_07045 [Clostridia bacterium]|nr:hypothetical protein [Clostridia bacterium]MBO7319756.1 hypothetical protein [Clostridia bacterium]
MENEINISSEQINSVLERFGVSSKSNSANVEDAIRSTLTPEQQAKINNLLSDPERLKRVLSSPQAKMIINMIKDKKE